MTLRIRCPSCKTVNTVGEEKRGRKVRCEECEKPISVPEADDDQAAIQKAPKIKSKAPSGSTRDDDEDDDYDDRPRRKRRSSRASGDSSMMYLLIGGGILVLCMCIGLGGGLIVLLSDAPALAGKKAARGDRKRKGVNQDFNLVAKGKVVLNVNANLTENDPPDPTPALREFDARMKVHQVMMQPGKTYVITMDSDDFDAYLRVESPQGANLVEDDDSGGDLNSKIVFRPAEAGMHRVIATSFDGDFGRYRLKVQEAE